MSTQNTDTGLSSCFLTPEILRDGIVSLYVGPKRKKIDVHKKLLCDSCNFFSAAFKGSFKEAREGEMYLPDDDADAVASLINYLYRGVISIVGEMNIWKLLQFYFLAEKLIFPDLMDQIMTAMRLYQCQTRTIFSDSHISEIYKNTPENSKLRRYCVATIACRIAQRGYNHKWTQIYVALFDTCPDLFRDIFQFQAEHSGKIPLQWPQRPCDTVSFSHNDHITFPIDACEFHVHKDGKLCCLKAKNKRIASKSA